MSPLEAIGYAIAAVIFLPVIGYGLVIAVGVLTALTALLTVAFICVQEWASDKWCAWKRRK